MDRDNGLSQYLLIGNQDESTQNGKSQIPQFYDMSQKQDDENFVISQLINEQNNIKQLQSEYGMPEIGNLFNCRPQDVRETVNSVLFMLKQRIQDIDMRNETRQKINRAESNLQDSQNQLKREKNKTEQMQKEINDLKNQVKNLETKLKSEQKDRTTERDELLKSMTKIEHKESQYKHEIKNLSLQLTKIQDQLKAKLYDKKAGKENLQPNDGQMGIQTLQKIQPSNDVIFSKLSAESDMHLMICKSLEESYKKVQDENHNLKGCLKMLQQEMFEIVKLKSEVYQKRFKAENYKANDPLNQATSDEILRHELEKIRDALFNLPYEESSQQIIQQFKQNFQRLKKFMESIDKSIGELQVFNQKSGNDNLAIEDDEKGMHSVIQLKELLRNYEGIVEAQHHLLQTSITKMGSIPAPDEITSTFEKFQILKDEEIDEMRQFLNEHKQIMQNQYSDFESEKRQFEEMNLRMEESKKQIVQEREKIENEIRSIRALNDDLYKQNIII